MVYRLPRLAPLSRVPEGRRGRVAGHFCLSCGSIYPRFAARHQGKPAYGKDHVAAPCSQEGRRFDAGESWWEPAVEILPQPDEASG